jgi:hypothetical protein
VRKFESVVRYTSYVAVNVASVERAPNSCATATALRLPVSTVTCLLTSTDCCACIERQSKSRNGF